MAKPKSIKDKAKADERPRVLLAYAGVTMNSKKAISHIYHEVGEDWRTNVPDDRVHGFDAEDSPKSRWYGKRFGFATPGTIISIEVDPEDGAVYGTTAKRVGQYDGDLCLQWSTQSRAVEDAKAGVSAAKKAEKADKDRFVELLEPIRKAYHECRSETQRVAILNRIHAIITRRRKGDRFKLYL